MLSNAQMERYKKGATLFRQGERARNMWIVLEGWAHLVRSSEDRDASQGVVLFTITPDEALCGISALEAGVYNLSAIAGTECHVVRIPGKAFNEALREEPGFAYHALRLCARRIQHIAQQYGSMAEPVSDRVIRAILRLSQQFGATLPVTHRELAQMSWTTTESAIRVVRRLKAQGYVTGTRGRLRISDAHMLEQMVEQANGHHASALVEPHGYAGGTRTSTPHVGRHPAHPNEHFSTPGGVERMATQGRGPR